MPDDSLAGGGGFIAWLLAIWAVSSILFTKTTNTYADSAVLLSSGIEHRALPASRWPGALRLLTRPRRILLLLAGVWVLNAFDLGYTLLEASRRQFFEELNPVAAALLGGPDHWIVAYKAGLVLAGSAILLSLRRFAVAELSCWLLFTTYCYVGGLWARYYQELLVTLCDPTQVPVLLSGP